MKAKDLKPGMVCAKRAPNQKIGLLTTVPKRVIVLAAEPWETSTWSYKSWRAQDWRGAGAPCAVEGYDGRWHPKVIPLSHLHEYEAEAELRARREVELQRVAKERGKEIDRQHLVAQKLQTLLGSDKVEKVYRNPDSFTTSYVVRLTEEFEKELETMVF